jgi:hypothetical protein
MGKKQGSDLKKHDFEEKMCINFAQTETKKFFRPIILSFLCIS